ncbi:hypothetical protein BJX62DRAFT_221270 [Aspergillus germanicus]
MSHRHALFSQFNPPLKTTLPKPKVHYHLISPSSSGSWMLTNPNAYNIFSAQGALPSDYTYETDARQAHNSLTKAMLQVTRNDATVESISPELVIQYSELSFIAEFEFLSEPLVGWIRSQGCPEVPRTVLLTPPTATKAVLVSAGIASVHATKPGYRASPVQT